MQQVVIQPAYGNANARRHWRDTIEQRVAFDRLQSFRDLGGSLRRRLLTIHPQGDARFWGATAVQDGKLSRLRLGDIVLFTGQKLVRGVGEIGVAFRNQRFADDLWEPHPQRGSYHNVYSLLSYQPVEIPYAEIWELPGFTAGDNFMGMRLLDDEKSTTVIEGLRINSSLTVAASREHERQLNAALTTGTIVPAETIRVEATTYVQSQDAVLVHRTEALLVREYVSTLNDEGADRRLRTPEGGVADLYIRGSHGAEIIEAKQSTSRTHVRHAVGQLLDYARFSPEPVACLSVLVPERPDEGTIELLHRYGIDCIYRHAPAAYTRESAPDAARAHQQAVWNPR